MTDLTPNDLTLALKDLQGRQDAYRLARRYLDGDHRLAFASDAFRTAFGTLFSTFAYNRCPTVVDAVADRLTVTGWETEGTADDPLEAKAAEIWNRNRMPRRQGEVHAEALGAGDGYVIVWPDDEGNARIHPNRGHILLTVPEADAAERVAFAVKCWQVLQGEEAGYWRVTVYEADVITRYITKSKRTEMPTFAYLAPYDADGDPETANPYDQVPVFHFANNAAMGQPGRSELADVIPLQDGLNKSLMDMLVTGEFLGFPQRWVVGIEPDQDPVTGKPINPFDVGRDRMLMAANEQAKFGSFDVANIEQFIAAQDAWDSKIARVSRTPLHWILPTGTPPSGDSLKQAEAPFVAKVQDRQTAFGDTWAEVMALALRIDGAQGDTSTLRPIWQPAASRSEQEALDQALKKQALGVPFGQIMAEMGYSPDEIAAFEKEKAEAAQRAQEMFAKSFDRGEGLDDDEEA